jgi:lysozyme family protein
MPDTPQALHWKVVFLALVACYLVPGIVLAGVLAIIKDGLSPDTWKLVTGVLAMVGFLVPPVSGGYITARFAPSRPWRHVLVVGALGALLSLLAFRTSPRAMLLYALASLALAAFGGFIRLQGRQSG